MLNKFKEKETFVMKKNMMKMLICDEHICDGKKTIIKKIRETEKEKNTDANKSVMKTKKKNGQNSKCEKIQNVTQLKTKDIIKFQNSKNYKTPKLASGVFKNSNYDKTKNLTNVKKLKL